MRVKTKLLNGFALTVINLFSVLLGFVLYKMAEFNGLWSGSQIILQAGLAFIFSVALFCLFSFVVKRYNPNYLLVEGNDFGMAFLLPLVFASAMFWVVHYSMYGHFGAFSNVTNLWLFQLPTNAVCLLVARYLV